MRSYDLMVAMLGFPTSGHLMPQARAWRLGKATRVNKTELSWLDRLVWVVQRPQVGLIAEPAKRLNVPSGSLL